MPKLEIWRGGHRYEMCDILYWPEDRKEPDYLVAMDGKGHEFICKRKLGCWAEMSSIDVISELRRAWNLAISS